MKTYILGNNCFAREIFEQIFLLNHKSNFGGFIILNNDKPFVIDSDGSYEFAYKHSCFVLGTKDPKQRQLFIQHFKQHYPLTSTYFPTFCAEDSHISKMSVLGIGNVFCSFSLTGSGAEIGNFNTFSSYSSISYNSTIGDYNIVNNYGCITDYCKIGDYNTIGAHATMTPKTKIGNNNIISDGECLFDDMTNEQLFRSGITVNKKDTNAYF